jgi:peptidyl-prolyl cis-trans isomerase SurA
MRVSTNPSMPRPIPLRQDNRHMKIFRLITALSIITCCFLSPAQSETVERIIAIVGDRIILSSELTNQVQMYMLQMGDKKNVDVEQLSGEILNQMINDELILSAAREDTTITASPDEIRFELDNHIASLATRFPSEEVFLQQLAREGLTKRTLEKRLRPDIRDQILKRKIIDYKLSQLTLSKQEIEAFYESRKDSLPEMPAKIRLSHILFKFKPSPETDTALAKLAEQAREYAVQGLEFSDIADKFVAEGNQAVGGRIGFVKKSEVVPEFGRAAFNLQPGNISGPVRTEFGWHVIKSHNRLADSVDVSHILFTATPTQADSARTLALADSVYQELKAGANFKEMAKLHSEDDATRATGGEMKEMTLDELRAEFFAPLDTIEEGEITPPVYSQLGYHILKLQERMPSRPLNVKDDLDIIRNFASQDKTAILVENWVEELKKQIYVDVREFSITQ